MTHFSDRFHMDSCRRCDGVFRRDTMVRASKVRDDAKARGWYCDTCAGVLSQLSVGRILRGH